MDSCNITRMLFRVTVCVSLLALSLYPHAVICVSVRAGFPTQPFTLGGGELGNGASDYPSMSANGRYVAFTTYATNLAYGDPTPRVCIRDLVTGSTHSIASGTRLSPACGAVALTIQPPTRQPELAI